MNKRWIITALGKDRPGIVAGVTQVLYRLGCNLEDSAMTRLGGEFAVMLVFSAPTKATEEVIRKAFEPLGKRLRLVVHMKALSNGEASPPSKPGKSYMISVYGADKAGIVFRVSEALAKAKINITDVETHRTTATSGKRQPSLYLMLLAVEVPRRLDVSSLEVKLKQLAKRLGVEVSLHSAEADVL